MTATPQQKRKARARARERRENIRSAFLLRVDAARAFAVYSGPVDDDKIITSARAVAAAWDKLAQRLEAKLQ